MVLAGVSSASSRGGAAGHGVDRFYCPPAIRRQLQQKHQQQQQQTPPVQKTQTNPTPSAATEELGQSEIHSESNGSLPSTMPAGNFERFIAATTPVVRAQHSPKKGVRRWKSSQSEDLESFFELSDLWDSFREWSAYGAGVPLVLNGSDSVVQYYVPFLSAIQIYVDRSRQNLSSSYKSDGNSCQESSSEGSNESGTGQLAGGSRECLRNINNAVQEGFSSDDVETLNQRQLPVFQYLEHDPPYGRQPLADKISALASQFPKLKSYRSCDLLPSSWISVAWYPIYRIPVGPTLRDLDACFLTFHSLSTPLNEMNKGQSEICGVHNLLNTNNSRCIPLPLLGLASYKFRHSIWLSDEVRQEQLSNSLSQAAGNWLQLLQIFTEEIGGRVQKPLDKVYLSKLQLLESRLMKIIYMVNLISQRAMTIDGD